MCRTSRIEGRFELNHSILLANSLKGAEKRPLCRKKRDLVFLSGLETHGSRTLQSRNPSKGSSRIFAEGRAALLALSPLLGAAGSGGFGPRPRDFGTLENRSGKKRKEKILFSPSSMACLSTGLEFDSPSSESELTRREEDATADLPGVATAAAWPEATLKRPSSESELIGMVVLILAWALTRPPPELETVAVDLSKSPFEPSRLTCEVT